MSDFRPIFVVGVGRSGTTLLQHLISANSAVAGMPESSFFRRYVVTHALDRVYREEGIAAVLDLLRTDERFGRLQLDEMLDAAQYGAGGFSAARFYMQILEAFASRNRQPFVCDKDPRLVEFLADIHQLFGSAVVVHIIRDPRAVLASKKKALWSRDGSLSRHLFAYKSQLAIGRTLGPRLFGENYMEVSYEELTSDTESVLRGLCEKIGIQFEPAMLNHTASAPALVAESELAWKTDVLQPVDAGKNRKWKTELTGSEIYLTESVCPIDEQRSRLEGVGAFTKTMLYLQARAISLASSAYCHHIVSRQPRVGRLPEGGW